MSENGQSCYCAELGAFEAALMLKMILCFGVNVFFEFPFCSFALGAVSMQVCLVFAVLFVYLCVFEPIIKLLNNGLKNARGTLLQFPEDIITSVPRIRALIKEFAKTNSSQM